MDCVSTDAMVAQEALLPSVVKYFPFCPLCDGTTYTEAVSKDTVTSPDVPPPLKPVPAVTPVISAVLGAVHSNPVAVALLTVRIYPLVEATVRAAGVDAPVADTSAPLALHSDLSTKLDVSGAMMSQDEPL